MSALPTAPLDLRARAKSAAKTAAARVLSARNIVKMERRYRVVTLRKQGYTVQEIAEALSMDVVTVRDDIKVLLHMTITEMVETTEESRQLELERLDALYKTYYTFAHEPHHVAVVDRVTGQENIVEVPPDPKYAALLLTVSAQRRKLLALDIPETKKLDVSGIREYVGIDVDAV